MTNNTPQANLSPLSNYIFLIDAGEVLLAEGGIELDTSTVATVTSDDVQISLWQKNLLGVRIMRPMHWEVRRAGATAYIQ